MIKIETADGKIAYISPEYIESIVEYGGEYMIIMTTNNVYIINNLQYVKLIDILDIYNS